MTVVEEDGDHGETHCFRGCAVTGADSRSDTVLMKISGVFAILSPLSIFAGIPIGIGLEGVGGPGPIDFGNPETLTQLRAHAPQTVWIDTLALIGPVLALPVGVGWYRLLRETGSLAALAVVLWYVGMVFVITQDALQLALVTTLPELHAAASDAARPAIEAFAASMGYAIEVIAAVPVEAFATGLLCIVMLQSTAVPRWIGALGLASVAVICGMRLLAVAFAEPLVGVVVASGFMALMVFILSTGVVMLRWRDPLAA